MKLTINGEAQETPDALTVLGLIQHLELDGPVAVECNRAVIPRASHATHALHDGDVLEIVHFVGGG